MTVLGPESGRWGEAPRTLVWGARTDVGHHREVNEDSVLISPPLFAIADGMGGHAAGDRASALAVQRLSEAGPVDIEEAIVAAAHDVDALSEELGTDAGTTVTGCVVEDDSVLVFNVGDSRVYLLASGRLDQVTVDHSVVQELVDAGELDEAEAEFHPAASVITRALGFHEPPHPDLVRIPATPGSRLLVCSDGLTREVDREHLRLLLGARLTPEVTASALVDAALAAGGHDNVSVVVVDLL